MNCNDSNAFKKTDEDIDDVVEESETEEVVEESEEEETEEVEVDEWKLNLI